MFMQKSTAYTHFYIVTLGIKGVYLFFFFNLLVRTGSPLKQSIFEQHKMYIGRGFVMIASRCLSPMSISKY